MTDSGKLPTSGYTFERVYTNHQSLRVIARSEDLPAEPPALFSWNWRMLSEGHFEVTLQFGLDPSIRRPEEIRVTLSGRFAPIGENQEVPLDSFVRFHAPAILMPFVREIVTGLTSRGFFGALLLPPINVQSLMEHQVVGDATGTRQLAEGGSNLVDRGDVTPL